MDRRDFLKTVGAGGMAAGVISPADAEAQTGVRTLGPGPVPIRLTINGRTQSLEVEPRVTLLDAVRNRLGLTGLKRVCDRGSCGACTMIVDGRIVYACSTLAIEANGKTVRTVEGLAAAPAMHPVQQAFCNHDALMCGFCTPGFVMAAVALADKNPKPTREEACQALDGNICRCGTYVKLIAAVMDPKAPAARASGGTEVQASAWTRERERAGVGPREQEVKEASRG